LKGYEGFEGFRGVTKASEGFEGFEGFFFGILRGCDGPHLRGGAEAMDGSSPFPPEKPSSLQSPFLGFGREARISALIMDWAIFQPFLGTEDFWRRSSEAFKAFRGLQKPSKPSKSSEAFRPFSLQ
jgi:hypothetical protein